MNTMAQNIINKINNARRKAFEKTLPQGKTTDDVIKEETEKLKKFLIFLENCIEFIISTEDIMKNKIEEIEINTKQPLEKEQLAKELWVLRYAFLYLLFFEIKFPGNENEIVENNKLINYALNDVLNKNNKSDYLPWILEGFAEYINADELNIKKLKELKSDFAGKVAEKVPLIAFNCTGGRLAGEQHDSVLELVMTTIGEDKKSFCMDDNNALTEEEAGGIKKVIEELKSTREESAKDFFNSLVDDDK